MELQQIKKEEKEAENQLIKEFALKKESKICKLQGYIDDGGADGIIERNGKKIYVEARRKGFPNHKGKVSNKFKDGWESKALKDGIFLNELTIEKYKDKEFIYIVEINGSKPRFCVINSLRVAEVLKQSNRNIESTNSGNMQSIKTIPLAWFKEY